MPAPYDKHRAQLKAILLAWGMPEDNAEATAEILSWADLHGVDSHGISMLPGYDRLRRSGRANMEARPRIIKETPVSALVDGDGGLGHVPARFAMQVAIDKAKQSGMAIAAVRNSAHFGATGYYTLMAAKEGLIGMACTGASSIQIAPKWAELRTAAIAMPDCLALSIATCIAKRAGTWPSPPSPSTSAETGVSLMMRGRASMFALPLRRSRS